LRLDNSLAMYRLVSGRQMNVLLSTSWNASASTFCPNIDLSGSMRKGVSFACMNLHPASLRYTVSSCSAPSVILQMLLHCYSGAITDVSPGCHLAESIALIFLLNLHCLSIIWCHFHMLFLFFVPAWLVLLWIDFCPCLPVFVASIDRPVVC